MRRLTAITASALCVVGLSSCAAIKVDNLPQPGNNYRDGYKLVLEFANTLNLPDHAKVVMNGAAVGIVDHVTLEKNSVDVTARIDPSVKVPVDTRAALQQATVLGDIYIALESPADVPAGRLAFAPNGRIPLAQTTSPPQLEDTIASLSNFIGSGSIQRMQKSIIGINQVTPEKREQIQAIASRMSRDLGDLSTNIDTVNVWLNGVAQTATVMSDRTPDLQYWFSPEGMRGFDRMTHTSMYMSKLLPSLGSVYNGGYYLVPFLESLGYALGAVQKSKQAFEKEFYPWRDLITNVFMPADKYPAMNITSVQTADGREIAGNVQEVLRMLGAVP